MYYSLAHLSYRFQRLVTSCTFLHNTLFRWRLCGEGCETLASPKAFEWAVAEEESVHALLFIEVLQVIEPVDGVVGIQSELAKSGSFCGILLIR